MAAGIIVAILMAIANHFIFFHNMPSLVLNRYENEKEEEAQPDDYSVTATARFFFDGFANLVKSLDSRAAEIMADIHSHDGQDGAASTRDRITVITIDEMSMAKMGPWPWSRRDLGALFMKAAKAKIIGLDIILLDSDRWSIKNYLADVAYLYDVTAELRNRQIDPEVLDNDVYFGKIISQTNSVLSIYFFNDPVFQGDSQTVISPHDVDAMTLDGRSIPLQKVVFRQAEGVVLNLPELRANGRGPLGEGFINLFADSTGAVRSIPLFIRQTGGAAKSAVSQGVADFIVPSLPLEMFRIGVGADRYRLNLTGEKAAVNALKSDGDDGIRYTFASVSLIRDARDGEEAKTIATIPVDELGEMAVQIEPIVDGFRVIPAWEVLEGLHDGSFDDQYILIDLTAAGIGNVRASALSQGSTPGVFVHANMLSNMLSGRFSPHSYRVDYFWQQAFIVLSGAAVTLGMLFGSYISGIVALAGVVLFLTAGNYFMLFRQGVVAGITMPALSTFAVLLAQFVVSHLVMGRERRFIRNAFSLNVSPSILHYMEMHPDRMSSLQGEQRNMTVLFSDIRGFTSISEKMTAPDLAQILNEYLTPMSDIVMQNMGTVDKFMGDAVMAFWNAPTDDKDHAANAARAALAMQAKLEELQENWKQRGLPRLAIGCGINSGPMFAGYMGSEQRKNYTVMGDNVNIASRLEGLNKIYSSNIIISHSTREAIGPKFFCRVLDKVRVSGRRGPIVIYELLGEGIQDDTRYEEVAAFDRVFELYQQREFAAAASLLQDLIFISPHPLYDMYMDRLAVYNALPPSPDWDGVFTVARK